MMHALTAGGNMQAINLSNYIGPLLLIAALLIVQALQHIKNDLMTVYKSGYLIRAFFYIFFFYLLIIYGVYGGKEFIYFQF